QRNLQWMLGSTSWRLTRPIRRLAAGSPKLARYGRQLLHSIWLGGTPRPDGDAALARRNRGWDPGPKLESLKSRFGGRAEELAALLETSGLIDEEAYRAASGIDASVRVAEHYLSEGWRGGIEPGPLFDGEFLAPYYGSIGFAGPPAITYLKLREHGWPVYATRAEAEAVARLIRGDDFFDEPGYAAAVGDLGKLDPVLHYVMVGERAGFAPSDRFDPDYYADRYSDIGRQAINRLAHYVTSGRLEGRRPLPVAATLAFDRSRLKENRDTVLLVVHESS